MAAKITCSVTFRYLKIYINNVLHFQLLLENHDGVQSWLLGENVKTFFIEFYRKEGEPILLEYDSYDIWIEILNLIDKNI